MRTDVSEERVASIFRVQDSASQDWSDGQMLMLILADLFYSEDGSEKFLRNVGSHRTYTPPHPRRQHLLIVTAVQTPTPT
jgi:hypothetical protein